MILKNIELIIFDVDGVLINSKRNMRLAFSKMCKKNKIRYLKFERYFKKIGIPFTKIMESLGITKNLNTLKKDYFRFSLYYRKEIKPYKKVYETLRLLEKGYKIAIVTSKSKKNTQNFLKYFFPKIKFKIICSPNRKLRPKPSPDMLLHVCKNLKIQPAKSVYVGDTLFDYKASKSSRMKFIFAKYGYFVNEKKIKTNYKIKKFSDILKILIDA
tara:strand:+ start:1026 stop:1667 length:642 start_codon:yes stop_codon:yes gene_type:complete